MRESTSASVDDDGSVLRPIGYRPDEISSLFQASVIGQHASEAAFLWRQRERAARAPHYKLKHLARLDERVLAHLHGLRVGGHVAWSAAIAALEQSDAGAVFVVSYLAFSSAEAAKMRHALQLASSQPLFEQAAEAALIWLELGEVRTTIGLLQRSSVAIHQRVALGALAGHGVDPGEFLTRALDSEDTRLRIRALQLVGQFRRRDLGGVARSLTADADPDCRFWASWALALLGYREGGALAWEVGAGQAGCEAHALEIAMRFGAADWARQTVRLLASQPATLRMSIQAAAAFGDPVVVPWLLRQMLEPKHARVAGEAFCVITGADIDYLGLKEDAPEVELDEPQTEDRDLWWPNAAGLTNWWQSQRSEFVVGGRYLGGRPISAEGGFEVLRDGYQRQRRAAAIELAGLSESTPLFSVTDRADRQRKRLSA